MHSELVQGLGIFFKGAESFGREYETFAIHSSKLVREAQLLSEASKLAFILFFTPCSLLFLSPMSFKGGGILVGTMEEHRVVLSLIRNLSSRI